MKSNRLSAIPSVEKLLQAIGPIEVPRPLVTDLVRRQMAALRRADSIPGFEEVLAQLHRGIEELQRSRIQPVINGTGVLVHTNLGRAPLSSQVAQVLTEIATQYSNLEFDLSQGNRGQRGAYVEKALARLCAAEACTVVNNCAAALVLILRCLAAPPRQEVIVSRGELVQIGGGFRIPDILETSGARLREVGTTNRTSLKDYAQAIGRETGLILKVHRSNFFMEGFVASPSSEDIAALARKKRVPMVEDLGSGAVVPTERLGPLTHEPTPAELLKQGVDLVCFSGDKLLGGPQAGIIAGKTRLIQKLKKEPLFRALRCDKLILAALQSTADAYLHQVEGLKSGSSPTSTEAVCLMKMLAASMDVLRSRAKRMIQKLAGTSLEVSIGVSQARMGGGALPRSEMPSIAIDLVPLEMSLKVFAERLRAASPPIIGYVSGKRLRLDLRTIFPYQDETVVKIIRAAIYPRMKLA